MLVTGRPSRVIAEEGFERTCCGCNERIVSEYLMSVSSVLGNELLSVCVGCEILGKDEGVKYCVAMRKCKLKYFVLGGRC